VPEYAADLAGVQMNLAQLLDAEQADAAGALEEMLAAIELLRKLADKATAVPRQRCDLGVALRAAGQLLIKLDRAGEARPPLEESKQLLQDLVREHPGEGAFAAELKLTADALAELDAI